MSNGVDDRESAGENECVGSGFAWEVNRKQPNPGIIKNRKSAAFSAEFITGHVEQMKSRIAGSLRVGLIPSQSCIAIDNTLPFLFGLFMRGTQFRNLARRLCFR
ncbi:hypothetical protein GOODEAATRI_032615 [Goodea atripinnis]|uniref:Uncharacterized protein n=1 Tax=Goodea atripinnis TaxID=208336 RepID=A0ABV0MX19_9TELE